MDHERDPAHGNPAPADPPAGGRRKTDRRQAQAPFTGPDRRQGDRRTGTDRRASPRAEILDEGF